MTGCKGFKVNSGSFVIELNTLSTKKTKFVLRELSIERMEMVSGGDLSVDVASGMMCVVGIAAVPISLASSILTGGLGGFGVFWGMDTAAVGCSLFAASVGR